MQNPSRSAMSIAVIITNYFIAPKNGVVITQGYRWKYPSEWYLMINTDGAFNGIRGSECSTIYVMRDSGVLWLLRPIATQALDAASPGGLLLAQQIGFHCVQI